MEIIKTEYLKRDPEYIKSLFEVKGEKTYVKENVKIVFPTRFINKNLAVMGSVISLLGLFGIIHNGKYASTVAPIMFKTTPMIISDAVIDGEEYVVLEYDKGQIFMDNNNLVKQNSFMFDMFEEFYSNGKIPWYLDYKSVSKIFLEAGKYAGSRIGDNPIVFELLTSIITRDAKDPTKYYRQVVKDNKDKRPYKFIGLTNVFYSYKDTSSRLIGGYLKLGMNAALVNKEKEPTKVATLLRS